MLTQLQYLLRSLTPKLPSIFALTSIVSVDTIFQQSRLLSLTLQKSVYNYCNCSCSRPTCKNFHRQSHDQYLPLQVL